MYCLGIIGLKPAGLVDATALRFVKLLILKFKEMFLLS